MVAQQRQLSLNARTNVFGTLPPPAGHFENPDDASTSSDSFHSVVQNAGGAQQVDEGTGMEELLAHPQYREEEAQTEPTNARHSVLFSLFDGLGVGIWSFINASTGTSLSFIFVVKTSLLSISLQ